MKLLIFLFLLRFSLGLRFEPTSIRPQFQAIQEKWSRCAKVGVLLSTSFCWTKSSTLADNFEYMPALKGLNYGKSRVLYPDFTFTPSGLQYKVIKPGNSHLAERGDRVVIDWEGYTIGYYGRPFQKRNQVKGGAFDSSEANYFRWVVGSGSAITALDEVVRYVGEGAVVQTVVPVELGYPIGDPEHDIVGPKPLTFSGQRALNFVLDNQNLIDKTLLINLRIVRIDKDFTAKSKKMDQ